MNFEQLRNQLLVETNASPKKAAALGLLVLVGCYFWIPMAWKLLPGGADEEIAAAVNVPARAGPRAVVSGDESPAPSELVFDWRTLDEEISQSHRVKPPTASVAVESPFIGRAPQLAVDSTDEVALITGPVRPEDLGLVVSGTVVGALRRMAMISGNIYDEGENIQLADGTTFQLARVFQNKVVLERDGQLYELELPLVTGDVQIQVNPRQ